MNEENGNGNYKLNMEQRMTRLETIVDEIKKNHLVHIESKIDKMTWLVVTSLVGVIANLVNILITK
mgnify:CR=1 FL=1